MADETTTETVTETETVVTPSLSDRAFDEESWVEEPVNTETVEEKTEEKVEETKPETKVEETNVEAKVEEVKTEVAEPRYEPIKFANEDSEKYFNLFKEGKEDELFEFLSKKKGLEKVLSAEVTPQTAEEIIKLGFQVKYPDLTPEEINYKFKKSFGLPKEPVQEDDELDEDFQTRKEDWQEKVKEIETERVMEAKIIKPDLQKLKQELVAPDIQKPTETKEPTPEDVEKNLRYKESYLKSVDDELVKFEGFSTLVKDEAVEIPLAYTLNDDQKKEVASKLKHFAEENYNANALFAERWVNEDNTVNIPQMIKDVSTILYGGEANQKFSSDAATKIKKEFIKQKSNIKVTGERPVLETTKSKSDMGEYFFSH